jgi:uncharacterized membrane protein YdjX (TVP38/TMEM64 family)
MTWIEYISSLRLEDVLEILEKYESLGPVPGIVVPMIESFIPILPLIVILLANAEAFGLWKGFLFSWLGVSIGCLIVFFFTRRYGTRFSAYIQRKYPKGKALFEWIETKGFTPVFIFACFPFSPSALVNIVSGLSKISVRTFIVALISGKAFMIFLVSLVGDDLFTIYLHPWKLIFAVSLFFLVWVVGKTLEAKFKKV